MKDYSSGDLLAAILTLQEATAADFAKADARIDRLDAKIDSKVEGLRHEMNRRFDRVDERLDRLTGRAER